MNYSSDKSDLELNFYPQLNSGTHYSTAMSTQEHSIMQVTPLPVYGESKNISFPMTRNQHSINIHGHSSSTNQQTSSYPMADQQKKLKQQIRRERNRAAAAKCRQRKLDRIAFFQATIANHQSVNNHLIYFMRELQNDIQELKKSLNEHQRRGCGDVLGMVGHTGNHN